MIDSTGQVLYLNGSVDDYLQVISGEPASNLISMARDGLKTKLRTAINRATRDDCVVSVQARVKRAQTRHHVQLRVEPLHRPPGVLLVLFGDIIDTSVSVMDDVTQNVTEDSVESVDDYESLLRQLEDDLRASHEDLQATVEEYETANEEFKASNEEVSSINEELQSANEELETSKEELQSLNEELQTVNSQLEQKVNELESINDDLINLLKNTDIPVIFLDRHLCLKRFTPASNQLLHLRESDIGRPLADFSRKFSDDSMLQDAKQVLQKLTPQEKDIQDDAGHWYSRRIVPYRREDNHIDGVVITFADITSRIRDAEMLTQFNRDLEQRVQERTHDLHLSEQRLCMVMDNTHEVVWDWNLSDDTLWWNRQFHVRFGEPADVATNSRQWWVDRLHPLDRTRVLSSLGEARYGSTDKWAEEYRFL